MPEHSPLPWRVDEQASGHVRSGERLVAGCMGYSTNANLSHVDENLANAEFIVRAVNSHAALLAALKQAADRLELCAIASGSDREFAAIAVKAYRDLIATAEATHA